MASTVRSGLALEASTVGCVVGGQGRDYEVVFRITLLKDFPNPGVSSPRRTAPVTESMIMVLCLFAGRAFHHLQAPPRLLLGIDRDWLREPVR